MGIELMTSSLPRMRSTPELHRLFNFIFRAENEVRTRDPQLGRLMLYQLSYFRLKKNLLAKLLADFLVGGGGLEPPKIEGFEPTTPRLQITCSGQLSYIGKLIRILQSRKGIAKVEFFSESAKLFALFFQFFDGKPIVRAAEASPVPETVNVATPGAPSL